MEHTPVSPTPPSSLPNTKTPDAAPAQSPFARTPSVYDGFAQSEGITIGIAADQSSRKSGRHLVLAGGVMLEGGVAGTADDVAANRTDAVADTVITCERYKLDMRRRGICKSCNLSREECVRYSVFLASTLRSRSTCIIRRSTIKFRIPRGCSSLTG
jgi:hypothetical protein